MEKRDLQEAARRLAACELWLRRLDCSRESDGLNGEERARMEAQKKNLQLERETLLEEVNRIRAAIPKFAGKRCWWDVPFDEAGTLWKKEPAFSGIYSEQEQVEELIQPGKYRLMGKPFQAVGSMVLNLYQYGYIPLYLDKKEFAAHLSDRMERRVIYCARTEEERRASSHGLAHVGVAGDGEFGRLSEETDRQKAFLEQEMQERLERHNNVWDFMERWDHSSIFINEQRWLLGEMDTFDYLRENAGRDYREAELRHKAWEEQRNLEYRLQQEKGRRMAGQFQWMMSRKNQIEESKIRMMETAHVIYWQGKVMAVYLPRQEQPVYEIYAGGETDPAHLEGEIYSLREVDQVLPDLMPLFCHILENYGEVADACRGLVARPAGLSDEAWRCWAELCLNYNLLAGKN